MHDLVVWFIALHPIAQVALIIWTGISVGMIGNSKITINK